MQQPKYHIGIVGCGKMGMDIFNFLSGFSFQLNLVCKSLEETEKIQKTFKRRLDRSLKHGMIEQNQYDFKMTHINISNSLNDLKDCNLVIESISEDLELKKEIFQKLDKIVHDNCILASNSSSIQPSALIPLDKRKYNTIGMHFFYPVSLTNLVEVNTLESTSSETLNFVESFLNQINKFHLVFSAKDIFTINKLFLKLQAGCCYLHKQYGLSYTSIDEIIKETICFSIGVFEFFDHVGIDTMLVSVRNYLKDFDDPQFYQPLIRELEDLVKKGKLGRKSGEGFYQYQNEETPNSIHDLESVNDMLIEEIKGMVIKWYLDPIYQLLIKEISTKREIEHIVKEYMNASKSPFKLAQQTGFEFSI